MNVAPEAEAIMKSMPGSYKIQSEITESMWVNLQIFCTEAQTKLINRHLLTMSIEDRRRAELVKTGKYKGQNVNKR